MRLFETLGFWTRPAFTDRAIPAGDYWALFGSLPLYLGDPPPAAYLPIKTSPGGGLGVVVEAGQPERSLPDELKPALLALGRDLRPEATGGYDFLATAEIIVGLDRVITVDTAVANLSASLGVPTWVLLPQATDFRWGRNTSVWYPDAAQFRQPVAGDWSSVVAKVSARRRCERRGASPE
jgi:hypothetical protein